MDEESGRGDRKVKKEKKHKKHKKRAKDVEEDPVDSERGPDPQQQAKDKYNQSAPKDIEQKQVINWEDINYPPVLRLFHYNYHELKTPIEFQICQWEQWIFIFQSAILMFNLVVQVILTAAGAPDDAYTYIIVSFFLLLLYSVIGIFVHVWVYRALALESGVHYLVWLVAHFVWIVSHLVLALAHGQNVPRLTRCAVEGFTNISRARALDSALGSFWLATTVIESVAWLGCAGWGVAQAIKAIQHFNSGAFKGEVKGPKLFSRKQMIKSVLGF